MPNKEYIDRCLRQYGSHTTTRTNADKVVQINHGLYDLFSGSGWKNWSRFRVVRMQTTGTKQLIQVGGVPLSRDYRNVLLMEFGK
jgi:hypothetical protein